MLEKTAKAFIGQVQDSALVEVGFRADVKMNVSPAQGQKEKSGWNVEPCKSQEQHVKSDWSLEEALTSMEQRPQPPSVQNLTYILHKCRTLKNLAYTKRLYAYLCKTGLEDDRSFGNYLVPMWVQAGSMCDAQQAFNKLVDRNVYSWNSLISGYINCGDLLHALNVYQKMQEDSVSPDTYTFVAMLKACARLKDAEVGQEIYAKIARHGLERELFVGSTLVDMYAKCGSLAEAWEAFDKLPIRDEVSWNALLAGYAEHGLGEEALTSLEQMQLEGLLPNAGTFVCSLRACGSIRSLNKGREIHTEIVKKGMEKHLVVGSTLVDMYRKCDSLAEAQEAFDKLPVHNEVSWTALMAGYAEHGLGEEALNCLKQMQLEGLSPDAFTFVCSLKACGSVGAIDKGREIHADLARKGLERDLFVASTLVDMYANCGLLVGAQEVLDKLAVRNEVLWNALMAGYAEDGFGERALNCLEQMKVEGLSPNAVTFVCSLKACGRLGAVDKGRELHAEIFRKGLEKHLNVGRILIDMYSKSGSLAEAEEAFDKLPARDEVSWTSLMAGYAELGLGEEALDCLEQMQQEGLSPSSITFVCSLKACSSIGAIDKGREIHSLIARKGLEEDIAIGRILVDMYAKCGMLAEARDTIDKLPVQDEVAWTALMAGYTEHGLCEHALSCYKQMQLKDLSRDSVTFVCSLKACGSIGAIDKGREIYAEIARKGLERDLFVGSTLVDMYAKCGLLAEAREAFDKLPVQNEVSWTALIAAYAEHGLGHEALNCLELMKLEGLSPNAVTFLCSLKSCGSMGAIDTGREIHAEIARKGLERHLALGNTLVDMYAQCGTLEEAQETFDKLALHDVVSWGALMAGYAQLGESESVFYLLENMIGEGVKPNAVTFSIVLAVCCHTGLVDQGQKYFEAMTTDYGITPTFEHHTSMVDLLGRAGKLEEAVRMAKKMPFHPNIVVWLTVLGACQKWGNVELGRVAFEHAVQLDRKNAAAYVLMSNIYADAHMQEEEEEVEAMKVKEQAWKNPVQSWWTEIPGNVYAF